MGDLSRLASNPEYIQERQIVWYPRKWLAMMTFLRIDFLELYQKFQSPITAHDCGDYCAPYNELGIPFCCDVKHTIPLAYLAEWEILEEKRGMWRLWEGSNRDDTERLRSLAPDGQVLIVCQGHESCHREYRSLVCRAFPFFPYVTIHGEFLGLACYWEFEDRCWVISHLHLVSPKYVAEFVAAFDQVFANFPQEKENFRYHSSRMRRSFSQRHRTITLLHRNGSAFEVSPRNGYLRCVKLDSLPKFGPYRIAAEMLFADEKPL